MSFPLHEIIDVPPPAPEGDAEGSFATGDVEIAPAASMSTARHAADMITFDDVEADLQFEERRRSSVMASSYHHGHHRQAHKIRVTAAANNESFSQLDEHRSHSSSSAGIVEMIAPIATGQRIAAKRLSNGGPTPYTTHLAPVMDSHTNGSFAHMSAGFATPGERFGDSITDDNTAGFSSTAAPVGIGPHVIKKIAEAYEVVCKDLGSSGAVIAGLCGTLRPLASMHMASAVHMASSGSGIARNDHGNGDPAAVILEELRSQPPEVIIHHCTELHLILLRLLEVSRAPHHTALVAMQSMASLSPQQVAPFQTTHTMEKVVDDDGMKTINGYAVLQELGRGSCAKVKLAYDSKNSRMVAIKIVRRVDMTDKVGGQTHAQAQYQSLQREIAVMKKLRHKNIVSLYEVIDDPASAKLYIVMQYVDNGPITTMKGDHCVPVPPELLMRYARHIFAGLMYLHSHKVVHRDIKLENILVSKERVAYLADFGVSDVFGLASSRQRGDKKKIEGHRGTMLYMAPELLAEGHADNGMAVDMWACGVTLYAALTGELPFKSLEDILNARARLTIPHAFGKDWENLLRRLLAVSPEDRPTAVKAHAEVQRMLSRVERKQNEKKNQSLDIATTDLDSAFTPVFTDGKANSMLVEGRFYRAQLMSEESTCSELVGTPSDEEEEDIEEEEPLGDSAIQNDAFLSPKVTLQPQPPSSHRSSNDDDNGANGNSGSGQFRLRCFSDQHVSSGRDDHDHSTDLSMTASPSSLPSEKSLVRDKVKTIVASREEGL